jgi:K+-sensing histidine kinase KdpD
MIESAQMTDSLGVCAASEDWHLVLSRDGNVLAVSDGLPTWWVGTPLAECADASEELKEAGQKVLVQAFHTAGPVSVRRSLESSGRPIHVIVLDAVPIRRVSTDIRALLRSCFDIMEPQAQAFDVKLRLIVDEDVPPALVLDADKIAWGVTELIGNALRYARRGSIFRPSGSITVRTMYNAGGPDITTEVQDDGDGTRHERRKGLGLLLIREIVAAHGGRFEVHSDTNTFPGSTTVRLTLPVD